MAPLQAQFLLRACRLPQAWRGSQVWRILDTSFNGGGPFFTAWQAWANDPQRPRTLHYVAITPSAPERDALLRSLAAFPALAAHAADLGQQCFGLLSGFHRLVLHQGQVLLTLCIGPLQAMLREQQFVADSIYLSALHQRSPLASWDRWSIKALARLCRRGTGVGAFAATAQLRGELAQAGFAFDDWVQGGVPAGPAGMAMDCIKGEFQPRWEPGSTRRAWRVAPPAPSSCVVVGAGLAGATVAAALAQRGWQVTVLDAAAEPAAGASGLPVGLLGPQVSRDDSARSRLARAGVRLTLQCCHNRLQLGEDWARSGLLELRPDGRPGLPEGWPAPGRQWSDSSPVNSGQSGWGQGLTNGAAALWHAGAGWIKPARLVQACLAQTGVRFMGHSKVRWITRDADQWELLDAAGVLLARAPQMVVAAAGDSVRLLGDAAGAMQPSPLRVDRLAPLCSVGGQVSWAMQQHGDAGAFPPFPVNGRGSFVAHVPTQGALAWFAGATYEPSPEDDYKEADGHRDNLDRLSQLLPATASALAERFAAAQVQAWRGTRCTTIDRLPAVGALDAGPRPTLWVSTGMGSRGLTYAVLCAELLAAQLGAEPLPVEASLAKSIRATRPQLLHHL